MRGGGARVPALRGEGRAGGAAGPGSSPAAFSAAAFGVAALRTPPNPFIRRGVRELLGKRSSCV